MECLSQGRAVNKWWKWDLSPGLSDSKALVIFTALAEEESSVETDSS